MSLHTRRLDIRAGLEAMQNIVRRTKESSGLMCSTASPRVSFTCKPRVSSAGAACSERRRSASRSASFSSCSAARSAALLWLVRVYSF